MIVLDSDILSLMLWQGAIPSALDRRLSEVSARDVTTTIANFEEQMRGWMKALKAAKTVNEEIHAYQLMNRHLRMYAKLVVLDFNEVAASHYQQLRKQFRRLGMFDLKIAAIAIANHATLVTRNLGDFRQITGLNAEDWTKE